MTTITVSNTLDVVSKYDTLVQQSLGGNSVYIRAKETVEELVANGVLTGAQKAEVLSSILSSMVTSITSASMSAAIQWANTEKEIEFKKLELAKQLDILDKDILLKDAQVNQVTNATRLAKVESRRMYGAGVFTGEDLSSLDSTGKVSADIVLTEAQTAKAGTEDTLLSQKISESHAAVHKIVADTYVNYGNYSYTGLSAGGISSVTENHGAFKTLSDTQKDIAIEQAKGYTYNAWANALTGSASMLGTAIAAEYAEFGTGQTGGILLQTVLDTATQLKAATTPA